MPATPVRKGDTDRRQRLIDPARELFAKHAYDQVTTSEIAKNAGVAYGLIAHHSTPNAGSISLSCGKSPQNSRPTS